VPRVSSVAGAGSGISAIAVVRRLPQRAQTMKAMNLILCFLMGGRPVGAHAARVAHVITFAAHRAAVPDDSVSAAGNLLGTWAVMASAYLWPCSRPCLDEPVRQPLGRGRYECQ
jgi:hypothetical protein